MLGVIIGFYSLTNDILNNYYNTTMNHLDKLSVEFQQYEEDFNDLYKMFVHNGQKVADRHHTQFSEEMLHCTSLKFAQLTGVKGEVDKMLDFMKELKDLKERFVHRKTQYDGEFKYLMTTPLSAEEKKFMNNND